MKVTVTRTHMFSPGSWEQIEEYEAEPQLFCPICGVQGKIVRETTYFNEEDNAGPFHMCGNCFSSGHMAMDAYRDKVSVKARFDFAK